MTETEEVKPKGLIVKLCEVMAEAGYVPKRGTNERFNYQYATEADVVNMLREKLAKRNVFVFPSVMSVERKPHGEKMHITDIVVQWTFVDGDTGESHICMMPGCGTDTGDKGLYKAMTGSSKYLFLKAFMLPTGDDPEADSKEDRTNGKPSKASTSNPDPICVLKPGKQGFVTITGTGLNTMLDPKLGLYETERTILGLAYDGHDWTVPVANAFRLADACGKHNVGVQHMDAHTERGAVPHGVHLNENNFIFSRLIKGTFPKSGTTKSTKEKPAKHWECLEVIYDDKKHLCWNKDLWPYLEAGKGKLAVLETTKPFDPKKNPTIEGILRIGDDEYEVIEGKAVKVIQRAHEMVEEQEPVDYE
jgi:hypothetical protein